MPGLVRRLTGGLMGLVEGLVFGAFACAWVARYVRPGALTWPLQAFGPFLPYLALLVLVLALVRLGRIHARRRVLYGLALALAAVRFLPETYVRPDPRPSDLRVVTYNVPRWAGPDVEAKERMIEQYAAAAKPHVMAFQESTVYYSASEERVVVAPFLRRLRDTLGYRVGRTAFAAPRRSPQPVFSRGVRVVTSEERTFHPGPDVPATYVSRVVLKMAGREAVLYNVHLYTHGARKPWQDAAFRPRRPRTWLPYVRQFREAQFLRAAEADTLRAYLDGEARPVLVVGDFNATPHEWSFGRIAGAQGGLLDAYREAGRGWGATFHRQYPLLRIDQVLVRRDLMPVRARVPRIGASDHRPVEVDLRWR